MARLLPLYDPESADPEPADAQPAEGEPLTAGSAPSSRCPTCGGPASDGAVCDYCGMAVSRVTAVGGGTGAESTGPVTRLLGPWGVVEIGSEPVLIGRLSSTPAIADALADVDIVSRKHAEIVVRDGRTWLRDIGSANGTAVNEQRLTPHTPVVVHPGDTIRLGSSVRLELGGPA